MASRTRRCSIGAWACLLLLVCACPAPAAEPIIVGERPAARVQQSISAEQMQTLMKRAGYAVRIDEDGELEWTLDDYRAYLMVADDRKSVLFNISFVNAGATPKKINEWNRTKRYSRTYLDQDGNPHLELDLDLDGGVTRERILDFLETCKISFNEWYREVVR